MAPKKVSWTKEAMAEAVYAVVNDILPIKTAATIYHIPPRTLRDHVKKNRMQSRESTPDDDLKNKEPVRNEPMNNNTDTLFFSLQHSWYCHACHVDKMADMRQCDKCAKWYHETCVGLTSNDIDPFECPTGC